MGKLVQGNWGLLEVLREHSHIAARDNCYLDTLQPGGKIFDTPGFSFSAHIVGLVCILKVKRNYFGLARISSLCVHSEQ